MSYTKVEVARRELHELQERLAKELHERGFNSGCWAIIILWVKNCCRERITIPGKPTGCIPNAEKLQAMGPKSKTSYFLCPLHLYTFLNSSSPPVIAVYLAILNSLNGLRAETHYLSIGPQSNRNRFLFLSPINRSTYLHTTH